MSDRCCCRFAEDGETILEWCLIHDRVRQERDQWESQCADLGRDYTDACQHLDAVAKERDDLAARVEHTETRMAQAYQIFGVLDAELNLFDDSLVLDVFARPDDRREVLPFNLPDRAARLLELAEAAETLQTKYDGNGDDVLSSLATEILAVIDKARAYTEKSDE